MISNDTLFRYHDSQCSVILDSKDRLRGQGYITDYRDVYPDVYERIRSQKGVAYVRGTVPLKAMALLYDVVIAYIPPIAQNQIENRFKVTWQELIQLCQCGIVIPLIGKAECYKDEIFRDLLELPNPPYSVWARGLSLLEVFNMSNSLEIAREKLPVDAIASEPEIFAQWKKKTRLDDEDEIKARIRDHIAVLYADLCVFGCANEVNALSKLTPSEICRTLETLNEIRTYPILFGMDSRANYNPSKLADVAKMPLTQRNFQPISVPQKELDILFNGIGIDTSCISVDLIRAYRKDSLGEKLRKGLSEFDSYCDKHIRADRNTNVEEVCNKAANFQRDLKQAIAYLDDSQYARLDKAYKGITNTIKFGAVVGGLTVCQNDMTTASVITVAAAGAIGTWEKWPENIAEIMTELYAKGFFKNPKFTANMWSARQIVRGK